MTLQSLCRKLMSMTFIPIMENLTIDVISDSYTQEIVIYTRVGDTMV